MTNFTTQQQQVINHVCSSDRSLVVEAVAGSGKTTTILGAIKATDKQNMAVIAFNKSIADEISAKLVGVDWKKCEAKTAHSFGLRFFTKTFGRPEVNGRKVSFIIDRLIESRDGSEAELIIKASAKIANLVSLAKQSLIGYLCPLDDISKWTDLGFHHDVFDDLPANLPYEDLIQWSMAVLRISNEDTKKIDFDDMIYMPLLFKCSFGNGKDVIFVDEAQDTNAARRALVRALLRKGGKVIAVGDRRQAIYGFTGADADALDLIKQDFNAEELPLSVCFRCAKSIVQYAQQWVPHIEWAEGAGEGSVVCAKQADVDWAATSSADVVLCRNNKPIVTMAYDLLKQGVACYVEGRDVGEALKKLARKWKIKTLAQLDTRLESYLERETSKALAQKNEGLAQMIEDRVETLQVFMDRVRAKGQNDIQDLINDIDGLFKDTKPGERPNCLTLSSIHKSKGREWSRVFWLDKEETLPSKYARQAWQFGQEDNLCYVASTRAEEQLVRLSSTGGQ